MSNIKTVAIIPAAGKSERINSEINSNGNKVYTYLLEKPMLAYTLKPFEESDSIDEIIVVAEESEIDICTKKVIEPYKFQKISKIVAGGKERQNSVYNGLKSIDNDCDYVIVHDGARPLITKKIIERSIKDAEEYGFSVVAKHITNTPSIINKKGLIERVLNRNKVMENQTPQTAKYNILLEAYQKAEIDGYLNEPWVTDEASLIRKLGYSVKITPGSDKNIKITTDLDLIITIAILENEN